MRIAIIADIHGNLPALEAVLADIQRRGADRTIDLGDSVSGPLWPREVCDLLMGRDDLTIRGDHDRWVAGPDHARMGSSDRYAYANLGADHRQWLGALPPSADAGNSIFACHGTPTDDNQYLIEEVSEHHLVRAHPSTIRERLGDVQARVVLCGHSHQQHLIQLSDGPLILNPGSVGCPSYDDPGADPHVSESGSPYARYAVLSIDEQNVSADMIALTYDWRTASARAEQNGRPDWAYGLRTGWFMANPGRSLFTSTAGTEGHCSCALDLCHPVACGRPDAAIYSGCRRTLLTHTNRIGNANRKLLSSQFREL
jgi:predicted phosphodiesterase